MASACTPYSSCNYVSFSLKADVCSTYSVCDVANLEHVSAFNYSTLALKPNTTRTMAFAVDLQVSRLVKEMGGTWGACRSPNAFNSSSGTLNGTSTTNSTTTPEGVEVTYSTVFTQVKGRGVVGKDARERSKQANV